MRMRAVGLVLAVLAACFVVAPTIAWGRFSGAATVSMPVSSGTVTPATDVQATCKATGFLTYSASITWSASSNSRVSDYYVEAASNGSKVGADISNRLSATATGLTAGTTYTISVTAELGDWTAAPASITVRCGFHF